VEIAWSCVCCCWLLPRLFALHLIHSGTPFNTFQYTHISLSQWHFCSTCRCSILTIFFFIINELVVDRQWHSFR
jgi:hypothetical protein